MATVKGSEPSIGVFAAVDAGCTGLRSSSSVLRPIYTRRIPVQPVRYAGAKRVLDIVFSFLSLVVLTPLFLLVAIIIKLTSPGPVIFKQKRVGTGGEEFMCYKFRSMCVDAEKRRERLLALNEATGPVFKIKNDPRITPIGKFIRKFSIDELPQLFNVFKGDMSLVGPRPPVPNEVSFYGDRELRRLSVRPGLTCLWQINGRSNIPFEHWIELDLLYIETMSFWGDVKILCKTIPAVVTARGAH